MNIKKIISITIFAICVSGLFLTPAQSQMVTSIEGQLKAAAEEGAGYGAPQDPRTTVAVIIKTALQLIGIIFLVLIMYAGFLWMTAGGSEDNVTKAKKIISASVIGLAIVVSAYAITTFVFYVIAQRGDKNLIKTNPSQSQYAPFR